MSVPRERLLQLMQVRRPTPTCLEPPIALTNSAQARCRVFATTFNPDGVRTGNKILRQRLKGPALAAYYPRRFWTLKELSEQWGPELELLNEERDDRLEALAR